MVVSSSLDYVGKGYVDNTSKEPWSSWQINDGKGCGLGLISVDNLVDCLQYQFCLSLRSSASPSSLSSLETLPSIWLLCSFHLILC